jgi:hypothetical protein
LQNLSNYIMSEIGIGCNLSNDNMSEKQKREDFNEIHSFEQIFKKLEVRDLSVWDNRPYFPIFQLIAKLKLTEIRVSNHIRSQYILKILSKSIYLKGTFMMNFTFKMHVYIYIRNHFME